MVAAAPLAAEAVAVLLVGGLPEAGRGGAELAAAELVRPWLALGCRRRV